MCFFKLKSNDKIRYERQKRERCQKTRRQYPVGSSWFPGWGSPGRPWDKRGLKTLLPPSSYWFILIAPEFFLSSSFSFLYFLLPFYFFLCLNPLPEAKSTGRQAPFLGGRNTLFPTVFLASAPYAVASFLSKTWIWPYHFSAPQTSESPIGHISKLIVWFRRPFLVFNHQYSKYAHQDKSQRTCSSLVSEWAFHAHTNTISWSHHLETHLPGFIVIL